MQLIRKLHKQFHEKARDVKVACLTIGLSYTAVSTDDGGIGLAFTYLEDKHCCSLSWQYRDYEGESAVELLNEINSPDPVHRSMGLALINALNYHYASSCPEDPTNTILMDALGIGRGTRVAMVGFFRPLAKRWAEIGALVEVLDDSRGLGKLDNFYIKLSNWADVLVLTSTSILNLTTEDLLGRLGTGVKVAMLGPSTPMAPEAFRHLPVHVLGGTLPVDREGVLRVVRHGAGTPVIHRLSRKIYINLF